jgi:membrane-bound ClpP family serine protease
MPAAAAAPTAPNTPARVPPARDARRLTARDRLRAIAAPEPGWRRFVIHYVGTAVGGYLLLMVVIIGYYFGISPVAGNFVQSAFSGCALLIGLATPVFIALSWLVERKGWRI